jgi:hypothetical protein
MGMSYKQNFIFKNGLFFFYIQICKTDFLRFKAGFALEHFFKRSFHEIR